MSSHYDVIVAGVGSMGAAACYHLAKRGVNVLGLERDAIPHGQGAHHGHSRMIRLAYFEHPDYVPLLQRAFDLWEALKATSGYEILHLTGGLYMGPPDASIITGSLAASQKHQLKHEMLTREEIRVRFPTFHLPEDWVGFYEEKAGYIVPEKAVCAHVEQALHSGAEIRGHEKLLKWESTRKGIRVTTDRGTCTADQLVITTGAWTGEILQGLNLDLTVTRQALSWFWPREPEPFREGTFPCWFLAADPQFGFYGFPMNPDNPGLKIALHKPGLPVSPHSVSRSPLPEDEQVVRDMMADHLPAANGSLLALRICLYTNSPDGHFIVDQHPENPNVHFACGFSGHGFKFASVMGEALADLASNGKTELPVDFLRLKRFG